MKRSLAYLFVCIISVGLGALIVGCDFSTGGSGVNTSQGAGRDLNISGVYNGNLGGVAARGLVLGGMAAVSSTSGGPISSFVIHQSGNVVEITDNNGSKYQGNVGAPGTVSTPSIENTFPAGAQLTQANINWGGHDNVANKRVSFAGVVHVVTVQDVQGNVRQSVSASTDSTTTDTTATQTDTSTGDGTSGTTSQNGTSNTTTFGPATTATNTGTQVITEVIDTGNGIVTNVITISQGVTNGTTGVSGNSTNIVISSTTSRFNNQSQTDNSTATGTQTTNNQTLDTSGSTQTIDNQFVLTEANTQLRLQGSWIEEGGVSSQVDAISAGSSGVITFNSTVAAGSTATQEDLANQALFNFLFGVN